MRHARDIELTNVEIAVSAADARAAIWAEDVDGLDVFRMRPGTGTTFELRNVRQFRNFGSIQVPDRILATAEAETF